MKQKLLAVLTVLLLLTGCASSPAADDPGTQPFSTVLTEAASASSEAATINRETVEATPAAEPDDVADTVTTEAALEETVFRFTETDAPEQTEPASETATHTETKPSETQPTETAQPKPTQPKPTETQPAETQPTEPAPTQPSPSEPSTTEPSTTKPKPTEPTPPPHTHSWGAWQQVKAPTCAEPGEERRTCPGCGAVESRPIAATGNHSWNETAPTCTQDGVKSCQVCGIMETTEALGHDWVHYDETGHWETLVTCYCGAQFSSDDAWYEHASASTDLDYLNAHAGYEAHPIWVTDHPAQDICSRCGAVK